MPRPKLVDHPEHPDFWKHDPPILRECWICGLLCEWVYLDLGYQHPECEWPEMREVKTGAW